MLIRDWLVQKGTQESVWRIFKIFYPGRGMRIPETWVKALARRIKASNLGNPNILKFQKEGITAVARYFGSGIIGIDELAFLPIK